MSLCQALISPLVAYLFDRVFAQSMAIKKLQFIDRFFADTIGNSPEILVWVLPLTFIFLYFINGIARYLHMFTMRYTGDKVSADLRQALLEKYTRLNLNFHNNYTAGSGGLLSRTMNDVITVQNSTGILADLIREPLLAVLLIAYMIYIDWEITLTLFIAAPLIGFLLQRLAKSLRKYGYLHQEIMESITSKLKEGLDGIRIIQSYNLEEKIAKGFQLKNKHYVQTRKKIVAREEVAGPTTEFIGVIIFGAMIYYFGSKVIDQTSSPGVFISFVAAMGLLQKPIKKVQEAFIRIQQTVVSTDRILSILKDDRVVIESQNPQNFPQNWSRISFNSVGFSYDDEKILDNFNLSIKKGEVIAIVGASGSGKSTLMNLLGRFFDPTEGRILIDETDISELRLPELRKNIALVTQDVFLFNDSIENNIRFGDLKAQRGVEGAADSANATSFIEKMPNEFKSPVGERGNLLSGGEKQRISIARAVYKDAPILILDEATSALDSVSEMEVQKGLEKLMEGRTAFVIAHRLSTVKKADRILVLDKGKIVEQGSHDELLARKGAYFQFHELQRE